MNGRSKGSKAKLTTAEDILQSTLLHVHGEHHPLLLEFGIYLCLGEFSLAKCLKGSFRFLLTSLHDKPPRRFIHEPYSNCEDARNDKEETQRNPP
jgi:hypothetical protein